MRSHHRSRHSTPPTDYQPLATSYRQPPTGHRPPATVLLLLTLLLTSCSLGVDRGEVSDTLYFGTAKADGSAVSDAEWQRFLAEEISKRFPAGLTTWEANGQWRTQTGQIERERTHIVQIIHADSFPVDESVRTIIEAYKRTFAQETVLRVRTHVSVAFQ